jgi:L,D-peptidoglycan transpeptidase YkuD (ErfK/YbiS/YcfS/YnhG family)
MTRLLAHWICQLLASSLFLSFSPNAGPDRDSMPPAEIPAATRQAVVVRPVQGFHATLTGWERDPSGWHRTAGPWPAVVGREGFAAVGAKREGDGRTPSGVFRLGLAFGRPDSLPTGLVYRQATDDDYWVDDPTSPLYNQWVRGKPVAKSAEKMLLRSGLYDAGIVVEYNTAPVVPGRGSAIFVHLWDKKGRKGTAGCVALAPSHLAALLRWLDAQATPVIVLGPPPVVPRQP